MNLEIVERGTVFRSDAASTQSATFPDLTVLPGGRWLCSFRAAGSKESCVGERTIFSWSDDEGKTWSAARAPFDPPCVDGRPGNFRVGPCSSLGGREVLAALAWVDQSKPERPLFDAATDSLLDMKIFFARSGDGGASWSAPQLIDIPSRESTPITGPLLILSNGKWLCHYETNKPYDTEGEWVHKSCCIGSTDEGKNWSEPVQITDSGKGVFFWDQRPAVMADGSLLNLFWTYDNAGSEYLNIHACTSADGGETWSAARDTGVPGQPAAPVDLGKGRVVMVFMDRRGVPQLKARLSLDRGMTWPSESEIVLASSTNRGEEQQKKGMGDAWAEMEAFSMGLPATAHCEDGDVLAVYYSGHETDKTGIEWVRLRLVESSGLGSASSQPCMNKTVILSKKSK